MAFLSAYYPQPVVAGTAAGTYAEGDDAAFKVGSDDIEITDAAKGIILRSPNNNRWRITINNDGTLSRTALALMALLSFATGGFAQVRDMVTDASGNVVTGRTNQLTFSNALNFTNSLTTDTTRTNIGLADYQVSSIFPSESDGTAKVRYPFGQTPSSAPSSSALSSNAVSLLPFFMEKRTTNFQAVTIPIVGGGTGSPLNVYVGIYSANTGLRTATLLESTTVTAATNPAQGILNRTATFTNQGKTLERGWYILSAFYVGPSTLTNNGSYSTPNRSLFGTESAVISGAYNQTYAYVTNSGTNFPASLTNVTAQLGGSSLLWVYPYY